MKTGVLEGFSVAVKVSTSREAVAEVVIAMRERSTPAIIGSKH